MLVSPRPSLTLSANREHGSNVATPPPQTERKRALEPAGARICTRGMRLGRARMSSTRQHHRPKKLIASMASPLKNLL